MSVSYKDKYIIIGLTVRPEKVSCWTPWVTGGAYQHGSRVSGSLPHTHHCPLSPCRVPVGAGQPRNSSAGGAPAMKGAPGSIHPIGAGHTNATTAVRPIVPITAPQTHPQLQAASPQLNNCLRYSAQQPGSQTRNAMQMGTCLLPCAGRIDVLPF